MDPTHAELATFVSVPKVLCWAGFDEEDLVDPTTPGGSLMTALGARPAQHPRVLGAIPEEDFASVIANWKPGGTAPPTPVQRAMAGLVGRAARIACGASPTLAEESTKAKQQAVDLSVACQALATAVPAFQQQLAVRTAPPPDTSREVKLSSVANQGLDSSRAFLPHGEVTAAYARYKNVYYKKSPQ